MGGFIDCRASLGIKSSPRLAEIEKAQAELRQEYDVLEERKRELEFLEKGGNPLDFKFGRAASVTRQSTSFTDQRADQNVTSEAKGSFALAASPCGDSVESSGKPGGSSCREPNIADNLLLFDGENSNAGGERNLKRTGKRAIGSLAEKSSVADSCNNAKETEDSLIFHLGTKRRAYARRNRSRISRDNHANKSRAPSSAMAESHGLSVSNSKPASPDINIMSKVSTSGNQLDMEIDEVQAHHSSTDITKEELRSGDAEVRRSKNMQDSEHANQHMKELAEQVATITTSRPSDLSGKDEATSVDHCSIPLKPTADAKDTQCAERVDDSSISGKGLTVVLENDLNRNNSVVGSVAEVGLSNLEKDTSHAYKENNTSENAINDSSGVAIRAECRIKGDSKESLESQRASDNNVVRENSLLIGLAAPVSGNDEPGSLHPNSDKGIGNIKDEIEICDNRFDKSNEVRPLANAPSLEINCEVVPKTERKLDTCLVDSSHSISKADVITSNLVAPTCELSTSTFSKKGVSATSALENFAGNHFKLTKRAHEDAILKEARLIEANRKRVGQLSTSYKPKDKRRKSHWDFVLEEMAWMANDFMQERLWKSATAAYLCHHISSSGKSKFEQKISCRKQRSIARTLAKAVMHFWHSADVIRVESHALLNEELNSDQVKRCKVITTANQVKDNKYAEIVNAVHHRAIQAYAVRFLKYDCSTSNHHNLADAPPTPDRTNDSGTLEMSLDDGLTEESLFYEVPPGAMQIYRADVESQLVNYKQMDNSAHKEDCEASLCDSMLDGPWENEDDEEEECEKGSYNLPGTIEATMPSKFTYKKKKNFQQKLYTSQLYDLSSDFPYDPLLEGKFANHALTFTGKRSSSDLNAGSIPTKRVRTAARQRIVSNFGAGATGNLQLTNKTDVSSGDTNSMQDDQSSMHAGSQSREVESTVDFEKQLALDGCEISMKPKKKSKHLGYSIYHSDTGVLVVPGKGSMFDRRSQADPLVQHEQRDQLKKMLENHHLESNGRTVGIYGQHAAKKPKLSKQMIEPSPEGIMSAAGSMPSPVASQMSNMSNQNKLKIIANRDRGKKNKTMKTAAGQPGSGIPWTKFEDQALVVSVHDMGPNWELVSDAISSTLQFKCIFRKPKECKERHKFLLDRSTDGADSAEDSGSSQPYPSTLPGIPKGSAGQLFQRLQGPMVEDTLKAHFEKIIIIGQKLHSCRSQKSTLELKQITPVHSSHVVALSQTCPNNLAGGVLSPLELCDISSSPDVLTLGYQGSHSNSPAFPSHQGSPSPVVSSSGTNTMLQGSSGTVLGSNALPSSTPSIAPIRDGQSYCMPRASMLPVDDQQRIHYAHMLSGRNVQQPSISLPGALPIGVDRNAYALPNGNGMGMMGGRTMPRPGFQGVGSPGIPVVSSGSLLAGGGVGRPNSANVHPVPVSGPGNSMLRPREAMSMLRPGQNTEDRRQVMAQDLQVQVSQGNPAPVAAFNALGAPFSSATGLPSLQSYPPQQHQQSHQVQQQPHILGGQHHHPHIQSSNNHSNSQHQAYAVRLAKERQLQQRLMPQTQQPYSSPNAMPTVQNSSQIEQQIQHNMQQIPHNPHSGVRMPNQQAMKQRQRQQPQPQQPRQQQQQKQISQQQSKVMRSVSRGPALMQQGQGFFPSSSGLNTNLPQPSNHNKIYSHPPPPQSSKQMIPFPSHSDNCNQSSIPVPGNHTLLCPQQPAVSPSIPLAAPQQQQQRQMSQNMQRMMLQQNRQLSSDGRIQSSCDQTQVNHMNSATSLPRCADAASSAPFVSTSMQRKPESSYDSSTTSSTGHVAGSPHENLVGTETMVHSSSEGSERREFSRSVSMDGHAVGSQWHPQQQPLSQLQLQQKQQTPRSHQQVVQGSLYARPSSSGPG